MIDFATAGWMLLLTIGSAGILGMLTIMASALDNHIRIAEHTQECRRIRAAYLESVAKGRAGANHAPIDSDVTLLSAR
ncbi:MAG: hypothetical protein KF912_08095 [Phycisphaeraceae bacterium]|nr:hypothetical protein [Phycisphaeraceae bacterium]MBX3367262.1 hypothetical protein [Phycisphaeraceae bacterium]QYK49387.1 MAG: hypothetical protein KF838_05925 [Phycisphaeraceae bacterium]